MSKSSTPAPKAPKSPPAPSAPGAPPAAAPVPAGTVSVGAVATLPPMVFEPRYVEKIWGGRRLETSLGKKLPEAGNIGESWEIYDLPPGYLTDGSDGGGWVSAVVANGEMKGKTLHDLVVHHAEALLGEKKPMDTKDGPQFPLLIKFLDAREDLSIQVHPTAEYAAKHPESHLKTECWIVMDHSPGAILYKGLKPGTTKGDFEKALKGNGEGVAELVGQVAAREGDCHFLPSGAVHALGAGTLVAEVQTPSDTTFRVFDFNRVEKASGKKRKLHVDEALACINFEDPTAGAPGVTNIRNTGLPLVDCAFFKTTTLKGPAHSVRALPKGPRGGEMKIWMILDGALKLRWGKEQLNVRKGQTVLLPASLPSGVMATFGATTTYLETVLP